MNTIVKKLGIMVAMLLSFLPALAYDFEVDSVYYDVVSLDEMTCEVVGADPNVADLKLHGVVKFKGREFTAQIKEEAFKAAGIRSLWIGDGMEEIPAGAFKSCENLTNVRLESVKVVGERSFYGCKSLSEIELGIAEVIESDAFDNCAYKTITIPGSVVYAGGLSMSRGSEVYFLWGEEKLNMAGSYFEGCKVFLNRNIYGLSELYTDCKFEDVTFGNDVTVFPSYLGQEFSGMIDLSQTNIRTIEKDAFRRSRIKGIVLPECLDSIKSEAFCATILEEINLPASLKYLGSGVFNYCEELKSINLPGAIKVVPEDCFSYCEKLSDVTIGDGIEEIGKQAFYRTAISNVRLPETLATIGEKAFRETPLSSIFIPGNVSLIKEDAFFDLKKLKKLELGESQNPLQIVQGVFSTSTWGSNIAYKTEEEAGKNIYSINYSLISPLISDSITHLIVNRPVYYDYDVRDNEFDDTKTQDISKYQIRHRILNYSLGLPNSSLTSLYIGENGREMFTEPQEIVDSYVMYGHNYYGDYVKINFEDTYYVSPMLYPGNLGNLKELTVQMMTPPELHADFPTSTYLSATLRVPVGAKAAYETAPYWKNFWEIVETEDLSGVDDIPESSCDKLPIEWYNVNGLRMNGDYENLPEGIYILRQGNKTKKIYKN